MLIKKIKFVDFLGKVREAEYFFNLSEAEAYKLDLKTTGGLERKLKNMTEKQDIPAFASMLDKMILDSYGYISDDGVSFVKDAENTKRFEQSNAYNELFKELITNGDACIEFIKGILPQNMQDRINEAIKNGDLKLQGSPKPEVIDAKVTPVK